MSETKFPPGLYWGWWDEDSEACGVTVDNLSPSGNKPYVPYYVGPRGSELEARNTVNPEDWYRLEPIPNPGRLK